MIYKKLQLFFSVIIILMTLNIAWAAPIPNERAQNYLNTVTFDNQSGEYGTVKLVGPTARTVDIPPGQKRTINVADGEYYILVRYGNKPDHYIYAKGDYFYMFGFLVNITLHKVVGGNYHVRPSSREEFDKAVVGNTENK